MNHRDYEPGCDCPGSLQFRYQTDGRRPIDVWECDACGLTNCPAVARRLREVWEHLEQTGRIQQIAGETEMKLRLSVNRKAGAPGYGSDGASAEVELDLDPAATPQQIATTIAPMWYLALETTVGNELARMQTAHPQPTETPEPAQYRPPPARHRPEAGWDDEPRGQDPPPRAREGYGGRQAQRNGQRNGDPRTGPELAGWTKHGGAGERFKPEISEWGKAHNLSWQFKQWPDDAVQQAVHDVTVARTTGHWGGN